MKAGLTEDFVFTKWYAFVNQGNELKDCVVFSLKIGPRDFVTKHGGA